MPPHSASGCGGCAPGSTCCRSTMRWRRSRGALPARAVAITFDDGYADNATVALPILRELGLPATFFIATGFLDGGRMWNDTVIEAMRRTPRPTLDLSDFGGRGLPARGAGAAQDTIGRLLRSFKHLPLPAAREDADAIVALTGAPRRTDLMMSSDKVRELAARAWASVRTRSRIRSWPRSRRMARCARSVAAARSSRDSSAGRCGSSRIRTASRPPTIGRARGHGQGDRIRRRVLDRPGVSRSSDSPFELPRFTPWGGVPARWGARLAQNVRASPTRAAP